MQAERRTFLTHTNTVLTAGGDRVMEPIPCRVVGLNHGRARMWRKLRSGNDRAAGLKVKEPLGVGTCISDSGPVDEGRVTATRGSLLASGAGSSPSPKVSVAHHQPPGEALTIIANQ
jgi:hypothetical protein